MCWTCFKWTIALAIVGGAAAVFALYPRINEEIRCRIEGRIAEHYRNVSPNLSVSIHSAELVEGKGLVARQVSIREAGAEGPHAELLVIEEVILECTTDLTQLVQSEPDIRRVIFRRPKIHATHRPDGTWSTAKLLPAPSFGSHPPEVVVENGMVEIFDPRRTPTGTMTLRELNFSLVPATNAPCLSSSGSNSNDVRRLVGLFAGDGFRRVEINGWVDMGASVCSINGRAEAIEISPELRDSLPRPVISNLPLLDLRGQGSLQFEVRYDPKAVIPLKYNLAGKLIRGRIDDSRLPHSLIDIRAMIHIDNGGVTIDDFFARSGLGTVHMSYRQSGFKPDSPLRLTAKVHQLELDRALANILPPALQEQWYTFLPSGEIDADAQLSFDGRAWHPEVTAQCLKVSFTHCKFPYRLEQGKGTVELKNDHLTVNLTAYAGSQPVRVSADVSQLFHGPVGWFEARGDDIQLDKSVLAALPPKPAEVVKSLNPHGSGNVYLRLWRETAQEHMHIHLHFSLNRGSIRYEKFPYPISDICGVVEMIDDAWTFRDLHGVNDRAQIFCNGQLTHGLQGTELLLNIKGQDVLLKEDLRNALSPHIQQVWRDLRPQGSVDLSAEVRYLAEEKRFSIGVRAQPQPQNASIEPVHFPYRLEKLQGVFAYRDGHVTFERCRGEHGAVKILSEGFCDFQPDGHWTIHFGNLIADRLRVDRDRDLIQAMPERLRKVVLDLNPTGSINLQGSMDIERNGFANQPPQSRWDVRLGLQQSNLQLGGAVVENAHGEVTLFGGFDGQQLQTRGEFVLDSLKYKDCQLTQVRGPFWVDNDRVLVGTWVDAPEGKAAKTNPTMKSQIPRPVNANFCGGKIFANGWVLLGAEPRYGVNATLTGVDLATCAREFAGGHHNLYGKVTVTADLTGVGYSRNRLSGTGRISLSDGNVYELPQMVAMLKILSIRPPDQNAFSDANINYRIEGEHIYFNQIDFHGDAISLRGKGEMNFQSQIAATFYATVGRGELELPVVNQIFRSASQQIMVIRVDGTLQDPLIRREALPGVNHILQELNGVGPERR